MKPASVKTVKVIIKLKEDHEFSALSDLCSPTHEDKLHHHFQHLGMLAGEFCIETIRQLNQHSSIDKIYPDRKIKALLDVAKPAIGSTGIQNQFGLTGKGVTIAIVDTGIYPHPDLTKPTNRIIAFKDFINGRTSPYDDNGHGTHVAGDAASNGFSSGGKYSGPAIDANLVGVKVLDAQGSGSTSSVLSGINWVIQNKTTYSIRILNLSLGAVPYTSYTDDPLAQAVRRAWRAGIVVFAAAGNSGPEGTINTPGFDPLIITVGAVSDRNTMSRSDDVYASYTSRGPTINGFIKPDIAAPGTNITSLLAPNSTLAQQYPGNIVANQYFVLSGTSMATPISAGACAQLLQAYPAMNPDEVKTLLKETSQFIDTQHPGYLIVYSAIQLRKTQ